MRGLMQLEAQLCEFNPVLNSCQRYSNKLMSHHRRLDHIVQVVREGQTRRAPIERVADVFISCFVPVITLLAIVTWVTWLSLGLSGFLPQDYLDISIGGWRKSGISVQGYPLNNL